MDVRGYASPADQAWLGLWVSLYGPSSKLAVHLSDKQPGNGAVPIVTRPPKAESRKARRPPPITKPPVRRVSNKIERDVNRVIRLPVSDWAKQIVGDVRTSSITLQDILDGIEDYFETFDQLRRVNKDAHTYFSRVGAPIILRHTAAWEAQLDALTVANAAALPSYFGAFFTQTKDEFRENMKQDRSLCEFHLFAKPKNFATVAAQGTTVFEHSTISLKRNYLTKEERREFPWTGNWGMRWYVGIKPDGEVRALPMHMSNYQKLPNGGGIHHSSFQIPPGLSKMSKTIKDPHEFARSWFNCAVAFASAGVSGITVTIRKNNRSARFGVPVSALKNFFADRDPEGDRRKMIVHFRPSHDRHMRDGRVIAVGEHLRGERFFTWRGYNVIVGVPGIHYPAPEGLNSEVYVEGDPEAPIPLDVLESDRLISMREVGNRLHEIVADRRQVPIRRGKPTSSFPNSTLP